MMGTIVDFEQLYLDAKRLIRELEAKYEEAEACARCEHEKRLGIEQQRDELLVALKEVVALSDIRELEAELDAVYNTQKNIVEQCEDLRMELADRKHDALDVVRAVIAKVEGRE